LLTAAKSHTRSREWQCGICDSRDAMMHRQMHLPSWKTNTILNEVSVLPIEQCLRWWPSIVLLTDCVAAFRGLFGQSRSYNINQSESLSSFDERESPLSWWPCVQYKMILFECCCVLRYIFIGWDNQSRPLTGTWRDRQSDSLTWGVLNRFSELKLDKTATVFVHSSSPFYSMSHGTILQGNGYSIFRILPFNIPSLWLLNMISDILIHSHDIMTRNIHSINIETCYFTLNDWNHTSTHSYRSQFLLLIQ
jgi:hypothetical protein